MSGNEQADEAREAVQRSLDWQDQSAAETDEKAARSTDSD
jgi:hypothetical protein